MTSPGCHSTRVPKHFRLSSKKQGAGYSWTQSRFSFQVAQTPGQACQCLHSMILPPGGQVSLRAPCRPAIRPLPLLLPLGPWQLIISRSGLGHSGMVRPGSGQAWEQVKSAGSGSQALSPLMEEGQESPRPSPSQQWSDRTEHSLIPLPCAGHLLNLLNLLPLFPLCPQVVTTHYPLWFSLQNWTWEIVPGDTLEGGAEDTKHLNSVITLGPFL